MNEALENEVEDFPSPIPYFIFLYINVYLYNYYIKYMKINYKMINFPFGREK